MTAQDTFLAALDALLASTGLPADIADVPTTAGRTRITSWGPADAPAAVLLHGYGATSSSWVSLVPHLARSRRVHAVDLIGDAGHSQADHALRRPEDLYGWLDEVVAWTGQSSVGLVGHSYGGWLACSYALSRPSKVNHLSLIDPTNCFSGLAATYVLHALPLLLKPSPDRWKSFLAWETTGTSLDERWVEVSSLATLLPHARFVRPRRPTRRELADLSCPTLVLIAGRSKAHQPAALARAANRYDAIAVTELTDASHHSIPAVQGDRIAEAILSHQGRSTRVRGQ
ncbi:alpha/beta fold hydrolase [Kribbella sp. NPDC005582]|uniref:alpha/beta fold hydrolase n=1 Tax=Kribbella sp. NPDC005582 TaxID=3156893 RepID=UPI0033B8B006